MHRFYLPPDQCQGDELFLTGREAHHAGHVLRVQRGEQLQVLDGAGGVYLCEVTAAGDAGLRLAVLKREQVRPSACRVILLPALLKPRAFEWLVQKATELGASALCPLLCERSVSRPDEEAVEAKVEKWRWIAVDALKQCGSAWLPKIEAPRPLAEQLARCEPLELALLGSLDVDRQPLLQTLDELRRAYGRWPATVGVFIGPEGDFSRAETEALRAAGARPVALGPRVLRSETAALCALALLNHALLLPQAAASGASVQSPRR